MIKGNKNTPKNPEKPKNIFKMKVEELAKLNSDLKSKLADKKCKLYIKNASDKYVNKVTKKSF